MIDIALVFALATYAGWGSGDIFGAIASRRIGSLVTTFWVFVAGTFLFSLYAPFALDDLDNLTLGLLVLNFGLGLLYVGGNVAFNEALRTANPSLATTINASFTALAVILSVVFLGEILSAIQVFIICMIYIGVAFSVLDLESLRGKKLESKGIGFALVSMICFGTYWAFVKILVEQIGWFWPNYISFLLFPFLLVFLRFRHKSLAGSDLKKAAWPIVFSALLLRGGDFAFNFGISQGNTSFIAPIAGAYPTLFLLIAFFVFKDPIKKQQLFGMFLTLIGVMALSFAS